MHAVLRAYVFEIFSLYLVSLIFPGLVITGGLSGFLWVGLIILLVSFFVRPVLSALMTPLTVITLGAAKILVTAIILFIVTRLVPQISIVAFSTLRIELWGFVVPSIAFSSLFAFLVVALGIEVVKWSLRWLSNA